jgi:phenylacetate-CoA ligase
MFVVVPLSILRRFLPFESPAYTGRASSRLEPWLQRWGRSQAEAVYRKASQSCPAYRAFLEQNGISPDARKIDWSKIPPMTKDAYVKAYSIESRCYGGQIPPHGTTIDESAGSSGLPINWVRSRAEREYSFRLMRTAFRQYFSPHDRVIVLNCAAMGPWGSGILISTALSDVAIVKSIGTDVVKLENALRTFGTGYRYLINAYPPFLKEFVRTTQLDLPAYDIVASIGSEAHSETLRDLLLQHFRQVVSGYGASDLEINMAQETPLTVGLRRWLLTHPDACQALFGRAEPPMIFQYNPGDYFVETDANGDLLFTICRLDCAAPKIRYNIRDMGGVMRIADLVGRLKTFGLSPKDFANSTSALPLMWLHGRSDLMVSFYGANIYPRNIETVIDKDPLLKKAIHSFQLSTFEDADVNAHLAIRLEKSPGTNGELQTSSLQDLFIQELARCNQDFREVSKLFPKERVVIELHEFGTGPFAGREKRIKNKYVA